VEPAKCKKCGGAVLWIRRRGKPCAVNAKREGHFIRMMGLDDVPELREVTVYVAHECVKPC
jgi:hypothetical protein